MPELFLSTVFFFVIEREREREREKFYFVGYFPVVILRMMLSIYHLSSEWVSEAKGGEGRRREAGQGGWEERRGGGRRRFLWL